MDNILEKLNEEEYAFYCPGCKYYHTVPISRDININKDKFSGKWYWNGSLTNPTFTPSIVVNINKKVTCHSVVKDGFIQFMEDCIHELKGKKIDLTNKE